MGTLTTVRWLSTCTHRYGTRPSPLQYAFSIHHLLIADKIDQGRRQMIQSNHQISQLNKVCCSLQGRFGTGSAPLSASASIQAAVSAGTLLEPGRAGAKISERHLPWKVSNSVLYTVQYSEMVPKSRRWRLYVGGCTFSTSNSQPQMRKPSRRLAPLAKIDRKKNRKSVQGKWHPNLRLVSAKKPSVSRKKTSPLKSSRRRVPSVSHSIHIGIRQLLNPLQPVTGPGCS